MLYKNYFNILPLLNAPIKVSNTNVSTKLKIMNNENILLVKNTGIKRAVFFTIALTTFTFLSLGVNSRIACGSSSCTRDAQCSRPDERCNKSTGHCVQRAGATVSEPSSVTTLMIFTSIGVASIILKKSKRSKRHK